MENPRLTWRKSTYSDAAPNCVEFAVDGDAILMRDSKNPDGGHLSFTRSEIAAFLLGAKDGQFDDLA